MRIKEQLKRVVTLGKYLKIFRFISNAWNVIDSMLNFESLIEKGILGAVLVTGLAVVWTVVVSFLSDIFKLKLNNYIAEHLDSNQIVPSSETNRTELIGA